VVPILSTFGISINFWHSTVPISSTLGVVSTILVWPTNAKTALLGFPIVQKKKGLGFRVES